MLYDDPVPVTSERLRHPYSLNEFRDNSDTLEYQWKLQRQQLDAFNDSFWRDVHFSSSVLSTCAYTPLVKYALRTSQGCCYEYPPATCYCTTT